MVDYGSNSAVSNQVSISIFQVWINVALIFFIYTYVYMKGGGV